MFASIRLSHVILRYATCSSVPPGLSRVDWLDQAKYYDIYDSGNISPYVIITYLIDTLAGNVLLLHLKCVIYVLLRSIGKGTP